MNEKKKENGILDCSTAGQGFARTDGTKIAAESCGLPPRGFAVNEQETKHALQDCSTAGMGFARTERTKIAAENCAFPGRGFATVDSGKKSEEEAVAFETALES